MKNYFKIIIKIIIAGLLLGCLGDMPYGYFQIVRLISCALFCWLAYIEYQEKRIVTTAVSIGLALLLNPIAKVHFKRQIWNNIDLIIAIALVIWIVVDLIQMYLYKKNKKK